VEGDGRVGSKAGLIEKVIIQTRMVTFLVRSKDRNRVLARTNRVVARFRPRKEKMNVFDQGKNYARWAPVALIYMTPDGSFEGRIYSHGAECRSAGSVKCCTKEYAVCATTETLPRTQALVDEELGLL